MPDDITTLTNRERRENMSFLLQDWTASGSVRSYSPLNDFSGTNEYALFKEMAYQIFASQKNVPEATIVQDWERMTLTLEQIANDGFFMQRYALDPPVSRKASRDKIVDLIRLQATRETWSRLMPHPCDPDVAVDVLYAATGGALKARAFQVVHNMRLNSYWTDDSLARFSYMPTKKVCIRAGRMGLVDLPMRFLIADMKVWSRALCAVANISNAPVHCGVDPILKSRTIKCESCDAARMASCPMPHCKFRRNRSNINLCGSYTGY